MFNFCKKTWRARASEGTRERERERMRERAKKEEEEEEGRRTKSKSNDDHGAEIRLGPCDIVQLAKQQTPPAFPPIGRNGG